jgi:hypothetical protein
MFNGSELALRSTTYTYEARATDLGVGQGRKLFDTRVRLRARLTDFWATIATSSSMFVGNGTLQCQCDRISSLVSSAMSAVALGIDFWCFMAHGCLFYPQAMNHASHSIGFSSRFRKPSYKLYSNVLEAVFLFSQHVHLSVPSLHQQMLAVAPPLSSYAHGTYTPP